MGEYHDILGMVQRDGRDTSAVAAAKVKRVSLRAKVERFALERPFGFIDEGLRLMFPDAPESSLRKRRTELTQENRILDSGSTIANSHGNAVVIWTHRDFVRNPPPIIEREVPQSKDDLILRLKALLDAHGIPY